MANNIEHLIMHTIENQLITTILASSSKDNPGATYLQRMPIKATPFNYTQTNPLLRVCSINIWIA